jgi:protein-tyrosine phosphatase
MWASSFAFLSQQPATASGFSPSFILPSLFLSGDSVSTLSLLKLRIRLILDVRVESPLRKQYAEAANDILMLDVEYCQGYKAPTLTAKASKVLSSNEEAVELLRKLVLDTELLEGPRFLVISIPANDHEKFQIAKYFDPTSQFIDVAIQNGSAVLVHCAAGVSRSPTIVAAFLCRRFRMDSDSVLSFLRKRRPMVCPNTGFVDQLRTWSLQQMHDFSEVSVSEPVVEVPFEIFEQRTQERIEKFSC